MKERKILVSGATGNQGGSVAKTLLAEGHQVVGISRNLNSERSMELDSLGAKMVSADFSDLDSLVEIMNGMDTVFSMTTPFEGGMEAEIKQGINMANAAKVAKVGHYIFNSVGDADQSTGIPHFDSKYEIEKHLKALNLPFTIVGPSYFMDNLFFPFNIEALNEGTLRMAMPGDRVLQQIAVEDIGKFIGIVVREREAMFGQRINISGDELSGNEAVQILTRLLGKEIQYAGFSPDYMKEQSEDMALMYQWFIDKGYSTNLADLRPYSFLSFEEWAEKQDWSSVRT